MKTSIYISGQISGNHRLVNAIATYDCERRSAGFNNYFIDFPTKKAAKKALWDGYKSLRQGEPEYARNGGIRYSKQGSLSYDASRAEIQDNNG